MKSAYPRIILAVDVIQEPRLEAVLDIRSGALGILLYKCIQEYPEKHEQTEQYRKDGKSLGAPVYCAVHDLAEEQGIDYSASAEQHLKQRKDQYAPFLAP